MHPHTPTDLPMNEAGLHSAPHAEERAELPSLHEEIPATADSSEEQTPTETRVYTPKDAAAVARQFKLIPHNAVKERYKGRFDKADKYDALTGQLTPVAHRYGISPEDPAALVAAILGEMLPEATTPQEAAAAEAAEAESVADTTEAVEEATEAEAEALPSPEDVPHPDPTAPTPAPVGAQMPHSVRPEAYRRLAREEAEAKAAYPEFDVSKALETPAFRLLVGGGVPMKEAYEMSHHAALYGAALEAAREEGRAAALREREAAEARPREGAGGYTAPAATDPARLKGKALDAFLESFLTR